MDKESRHELNRLFQFFEAALDEIRLAENEDAEIAGWRKVQRSTWELNQVLPFPSAEHRVVS